MTPPPAWAAQISDPSIHNLPITPGKTPLSWEQLRASVTFFVDSFVGQVAIAFGGIDIFGWKPFDFLVDWGQQRIADALRNYEAALTAQSSANYANSQLVVLSGSVLASDVTGGVSVSETFNGGAASTLPNFSRVSTGSGAGGYGPDGGGQAVWIKSGGQARTHRDIYNTPLATNYQASYVVLSGLPQEPLNGSQAYTYLIARCNAAGTSFAYARIGYNSLTLGCFVSNTDFPFSTIFYTPNVGDATLFVAGTVVDDYKFVVWRNGVAVMNVIDGFHTSQIGGSYLYVGMASQAGDRNLFSDQTIPCHVDTWAAADRLPGTWA